MIPNGRAALFVKAILPEPTDHLCCRHQDRGFAAIGKGKWKLTWRLLGHQYADADIRFVLSAVAAVDLTVSLHMRGLEGLLGKKATFRLSEATLEQQAFEASGRL